MPATENRDLAEGELWQLSLERSRRRRVLAANARKEQGRRKTASVAVSAAVAAAPMWPSVAGSGSFEAKADPAKGAKQPNDRERVLLSVGDRSPTVATLQRELRILADGVFGPQTQAAVRAFQKRAGLPSTGDVDIRTWLAMFPNDGIVATSGSGSGGDAEPQWAAVTTQPTGADAEAAVAGTAASATAAAAAAVPARPARQKAKRQKNGAARAASSRARGAEPEVVDPRRSPVGIDLPPVAPPAQDPPERPSTPIDDGTPPTDGAKPPAGDVTPPAGGGDPSTGQEAPKRTLPPAPPKPVTPIAPGGDIARMINAMVGEANRIDRARYSYRWGGGHNPRFTGPYDCSGAVSAVLRAAGLLRSPLVSGDFVRWGARGPGVVTIYANASHVYMSIKGRYFGTSRSNPGGGAGWFRGGPRAGFVVVHVPFERMKQSARSRAKKRIKRPQAHIRNPRRAPQGAPVNRVTGGTPAGSMQAPASTTPTTTPAPVPAPPPGGTPAPTPAPPPAAAPAPAPAPVPPVVGSPGQAAPPQGQPAPISVNTPAGSVNVTPPPAPSTGGGQPSAGGPAPSAPTPPPSAPVSPPQGGSAPSAPAPGTGSSGTGVQPGAPAAPPASPPPASSAPADPVGDVAEGAVAGAGKAVDAVTSTVAKTQVPPPAPATGEGAPGSG